MYYAWNFILPANQTEVTKQVTNLYLEKGTITRAEVIFPVGCANLVFVHINDALHQIWPKDAGIPILVAPFTFTGDGAVITCTDEYEIKEPPFTIQFHGWNTDDVYKHTITVRIQIVPAKEILHKVIGEVMRYTKLSRSG